MRTKYHWTQMLGILVCVGGRKGDAFMILGATLYGFSLNKCDRGILRQKVSPS
ncbi:hypothetical protein F5141DRAFT_1173767 [Pisolithus sp. B1]|nr:hypothetical protein F5141DRAFT_1173767 [Pisolithus sp. B1]